MLGEEFARFGVSLVFLKSPSGQTPEDQLLVQFQGMIAEYERAQIAERTRRGKRHKAQQGLVDVLGRAPYGYRYIKKSDNAEAYYEVNETEAEVVRMMFHAYTQQELSISAIARLLNERRIPTRRGRRAGSGRPYGVSSGIRPIRGKRISVRRNCGHGNGSRGVYGRGIGARVAMASLVSGLLRLDRDSCSLFG